MSISMHQTFAPVAARALGSLSNVLKKGEAWARARGVEDAVLLQTRLIPDMLPLVAQVRIATDMATRGGARLAGEEPASVADDETTFAQLYARIERAIETLKALDPARVDGSEDRHIALKMRSGEFEFRGQDYLLHFVLPNLFFHCTMSYALLRGVGVELGKTDFIGSV